MRQYQLYVRNKRRYEVIPIGFSWGALLLGVIWAAIYGLLFRYIAILSVAAIPLIISGFFEGSVRDSLGLLGVAATNAAHIYFSFKAFAWRESRLCTQGFSPVASIAAQTSKLALESWAKSDAAKKYLSSAA